MKKAISVILVLVLCISSITFVNAASSNASTIDSQIYTLAYDLLCDALSENTYFNIPSFDEKTLYLCEPINPHHLQNGNLVANPNIEYYLIKADSLYIACVTVCYVEDQISTATLDTNIALALNDSDIGTAPVVVVGHEGLLYIRSNEATTLWIPGNNTSTAYITTASSIDDSALSQISAASCHFESITASDRIYISSADIVSPRITRVLNVPFVAQNDYPICWAAAASALGQYHTGIQISALRLAIDTIGSPTAGTLTDARNALRNSFGISTTLINSEPTYSSIINYLMGGKPLLVGFCDAINEAAHMVVVCGVDYTGASSTSRITYYVRDSYFESLRVVSAETSGPIMLDYYYDNYLYWNEAAVRT